MIKRHVRRLLTAAAALTLVGFAVTVPGTANAATQVVDSFEGNPYVNWTTVELRGQSLAFLGNQRRPRTGSNAAWLYGGQTTATSARMWRLVTLEHPGSPVFCFAQLHVRKHDESPQPADPVVVVQLRPGTPSAAPFRIAAVTVSDKDNWRSFSFNGFPFHSFFFLDISATGEVMVDDIAIGCRKEIE